MVLLDCLVLSAENEIADSMLIGNYFDINSLFSFTYCIL